MTQIGKKNNLVSLYDIKPMIYGDDNHCWYLNNYFSLQSDNCLKSNCDCEVINDNYNYFMGPNILSENLQRFTEIL